MSWSHRVVRSHDGVEEILRICEVYYDGDNKTPVMFDPNPYINGSSLRDLHDVLEQMAEALSKSIINESVMTERKYHADQDQPS